MACVAPQAAPSTFNLFSTVYALAGAGGLFLLIGGIALFLTCRRDGARAESAEERAPFLEGDSLGAQEKDALIMCDGIPVWARLGILLLIFVNVALFISSNTSVGASVYLVIKAAGEDTIRFPSLFDFSLANSVQDMWNAKVYALSILIAVFSGIWPYVKLLLLTVCWLVPPTRIGILHRERILLLLDALGKCSLVDSFVMILMMVAFHFSISPTVTPVTPPGTLVAQVWVEPHYGFYTFILATMCSLVITHIVVYCHRKVSEQVDRTDNLEKKSLLAFSRRPDQGGSALLLSVAPLLLVAAGLVVSGIIIQSFEFEFKGAFGYLLTLLGDSTTSSYSVVSLGNFIPSSSDHPHSAGTIFLQVSFFIFVCAMPLAYLALLVALWSYPLTVSAQRRLLHVTEIAQAWSSLEVFVVAVIAALLELQQFAQFIIGDRCDKINPLLQKYAHSLLDGDDKCFDVEASLKTGCWVLFSGCLIYICAGMVVIRCCHKALHQRTADLNGPPIN
jgi:hypothetical protein